VRRLVAALASFSLPRLFTGWAFFGVRRLVAALDSFSLPRLFTGWAFFGVRRLVAALDFLGVRRLVAALDFRGAFGQYGFGSVALPAPEKESGDKSPHSKFPLQVFRGARQWHRTVIVGRNLFALQQESRCRSCAPGKKQGESP